MNTMEWEKFFKKMSQDDIYTVDAALKVLYRTAPEIFKEFEGLDTVMIVADCVADLHDHHD